MSIAPLYDCLTPGQRLIYRQTPDEGFFTAYAAAYADHAAGSAPAPDGEGSGATAKGAAATDRLLAGLFGSVHAELSRRRGVDETDQAAYAAILNRAYTQGGMLDPVGFLKSLSPAELAVVQRNHCLAMPIEPAGLSREGACNLLLPEGWRTDMNGDDLIEVGAGKLIQFPPADAPAEFLDAWFAATKDMDEMDIATYGLVMFTAMHTLPIDGRPLERTLPPDRLDSYRQVVAGYLEMIERFRGQLPEGQYERDKAFFGVLMNLMG